MAVGALQQLQIDMGQRQFRRESPLSALTEMEC